MFSLGIITVDNVLKWFDQWPKSIQALAISISLLTHSSFLVMTLKYLQDNLSSPRVEELLQFLMALWNFFFKKEAYIIVILSGISSNRLILTWWFWAVLNNLWRASYRPSNSIQSLPLNWMASIAGRFLLFTQFMSFQGLYFLFAISLIFPLKKIHLVFLTILWKFFQSSTRLDCL